MRVHHPSLRRIAAGALILIAIGASAQTAQRTSELPVEWITVDDGLPQGMVRAIVQDRTGYMWFATKDGLARSDGYGYTVFRHDAQDSLSICANHISSLYEDRTGGLWIGTESGGVDRYDPRTGDFAHMVRPQLDAPGSGHTIRQFAGDRHGHVLALDASGGLSLLPHERNGIVRRVAQDVAAMAFAPSGELWHLTADELVITTLKADLSTAVEKRLPMPSLRSGAAGLFADTLRSRMLLVRDGRVLAMDAGARDIMDTIATGLEEDYASNCVVDGRDLWFSRTRSSEAGRVSLDDGTVERIRFAEANGRSLPQGPLAYAFARDRSGNLWVGTAGYGVLLHRALAGRFHRVLQGSSPWLQRADRAGREIVASGDLLWVNAPDGLAHPTSFKNALNITGHGPSWYEFKRDEQGVWWACVTLDNNTLLCHGPGPDDGVHAVSLGSDEDPMSLINCDSRDLWILASDTAGAPPDRLLRFDPITRVVRDRIHLPFALPVSDYRMVSALLFAKDGTLWMGTRKGLLQLPPGAKKWIVHTHDPVDPASLPSDLILSLCFDPDAPDAAIWVGTEENGMARLDMRSGRSRRYGLSDGLPSNTIYAILADANRNLWVSTNKGLCRIDPRTGATRTYSRSDGLAGTEFNRYSAAISFDGRFYFAGTNGITYFHPDEMYGDASASATVITALGLANKQVRWNNAGTSDDKTFLVPAPPDQLRSLSLPYAERSITISFACMDHSTPLKNNFRYKLEGFHNEWVDAGTVHQATFTNLDPGTYTFRVQGRNSADVWDEQGDAIELIIAPPWWGTWWFRGLVLLAIGGGLYGFYRYRLARAMEVVAVRERIARDLHDEIGSTLSSVSLYSTVAQRKVADKAPEANELLGRITDSTTQVLEAMNDIVWAVNADYDDMASVIKRMHAFAVSVTEARGCKLHLHADEELKTWRLEMTQRKNLYLIFKEAVNNAVKYSGCANLRVELVRDRSAIVLRVSDDGSGFDMNPGSGPGQAQNNGSVGGGNGLANMRNRAAEIPGTLTITSAIAQASSSRSSGGTTVELRFVPGSARRSLEPLS